LTYVRPGLPPILSSQGDANPTVPYSHSLRLRDALKQPGVNHELITIPGGKHGMFTPEERIHIYAGVRGFSKSTVFPRVWQVCNERFSAAD
jgi:dipeptidyl aminopeptidase/acylaminoacyl peptidase